MAKEGEKPEGVSIHEALSDRGAFIGFLKEEGERESLEGLSPSERLTKRTVEYLESRGVPQEQIKNYVELQEGIKEGRARSEKEEAEARDKLIRDGVIEPGQELSIPATLLLGMIERKKSTY